MLTEISYSKFINFILLILTFYVFIFTYMQTDLMLPWFHIKRLNKTCNGTLFPVNINSENNWGPVDTDKTMFVISAYYLSHRNRVFIIGAKPFHRVLVLCQFWRMDSANKLYSLLQTQAEVVAPTGGKHYRYASTIFACQFNSTEAATHVSVVQNSCENPLNLLRIRDVSKPENYERQFTICLSPLFRFKNSYGLVEWIELNRILGAEKILLYNYSTSTSVENIVSHYLETGLVEIIQWRFPFQIQDIEFYAQKAALNDCLFRCKHVSEFIINVDTDEFIIPHGKEVVNWSQMIAQLDKLYAGYLIRHTFFRTDWTNRKLKNVATVTKSPRLVTLTNFEHENRIYSANDRSKYFARTAYVEFANVHEVPRGRILTVPPETGLVHHYRSFLKRRTYRRVKDFTVLQKFGDKLIRNMNNTLTKLQML